MRELQQGSPSVSGDDDDLDDFMENFDKRGGEIPGGATSNDSEEWQPLSMPVKNGHDGNNGVTESTTRSVEFSSTTGSLKGSSTTPQRRGKKSSIVSMISMGNESAKRDGAAHSPMSSPRSVEGSQVGSPNSSQIVRQLSGSLNTGTDDTTAGSPREQSEAVVKSRVGSVVLPAVFQEGFKFGDPFSPTAEKDKGGVLFSFDIGSSDGDEEGNSTINSMPRIASIKSPLRSPTHLRRTSTTFGLISEDDTLSIEWVTGDVTTYCSQRCLCFVEALSNHQQRDVNNYGSLAARYLENLCDDCKIKTAEVIRKVRWFLRCVLYLQHSFRWRYAYRRIRLERDEFLGGVRRERFERQVGCTKGRCMRCAPFMEMMRDELDSACGAEAKQAAVAYTRSPTHGISRLRRKDQQSVEIRKAAVSKGIRFTYFMCARCKTIAKAMLKQAAQGKLKPTQQHCEDQNKLR